MIEALVIDGLLALILLMLVPLGVYRGGMREVCSAAGLLLGILIVQSWASRWADWIADQASIDQDTSRFSVAIATLLVVTMMVGYGAGATFASSPGPGGRVFGGLLGLLIGVVCLGTVIGYVTMYLYAGSTPDVIGDTYLARGLSSGRDWVLLGVAGAIVLATLLGSIVRERELDADMVPVPRHPLPTASRPPVAVEPATAARSEAVALEATDQATQKTAAVKIREIRHWEEPAAAPGAVRATSGGWPQTWPANRSQSTGPGRDTTASRPSRDGGKVPADSSDAHGEGAVLRDWLATDDREENDRPPSPQRR